MNSTAPTRGYTRREFGRMALGGVPAAALGAAAFPSVLEAAAINSRIRGVQIGAITYSFRALTDAHAIVNAMVSIGLGEVELMSNHAEALAGAPGGPDAADALARLAAAHDTGHVGAGSADLRERRHRPPIALLQHEREDHVGHRYRVRPGDGDASRRQGDVHVHAGEHGEARGTARGPAQDPRRLSRPRQRAAARRGLHATELRRVPRLFEVSRDQPGHRPLHRRGIRCPRVPPRAARPDHAPSPEGSPDAGQRRRQTSRGARATRRLRRSCSC